MKKRFSFFVEHLGPNQVSYLLSKQIPGFIRDNPNVDICVFYESQFQKAFSNRFCSLPSVELWGYEFPCVSIGFEIGEKLLKVPTVKKKYHFMFDFEWPFSVYSSERLEKFYTNKNISFLVRDENYQKVLKDKFGADSMIVGDFNAVYEINKII